MQRVNLATVFLGICMGCLFLASCAREEAPSGGDPGSSSGALVAELAQQRDALDSSKGGLETMDAEWTLGDTSSRIKAYYAGETLALIEEEMTMGEFGNARSRYFYSPKGSLFAYTEEKESQTGARTGNARTERVQLQLFFADNGSLLQGERSVDGAKAELTGVESQGVKLHARELELVLQEKRATPAR